MCYQFKILERICAKIESTWNDDENHKEWKFKGGCFNGGKDVALFKDAKKGEVYDFSGVSLEVRASVDPYTAVAGDNSSDLFVFKWIATILFWVAIALLIGFAVVYFLLWRKKRNSGGQSFQRQVDE